MINPSEREIPSGPKCASKLLLIKTCNVQNQEGCLKLLVYSVQYNSKKNEIKRYLHKTFKTNPAI